jgi:DNA polymerase elongation subunit (family B)
MSKNNTNSPINDTGSASPTGVIDSPTSPPAQMVIRRKVTGKVKKLKRAKSASSGSSSSSSSSSSSDATTAQPRVIKSRAFKLLEFNTKDERVEPDDAEADSDSRSPSSDDEGGGPRRRDCRQFKIQLFGIDEQGDTCSIIVNDYKPFYYIKVPDNWSIAMKDTFLIHVKDHVGKYFANSICECKLVKRKKLYGFDDGKQHKFVLLKFNNMSVFYKVRGLWYKGTGENRRYMKYYRYNGANLELYESNIPPLLRFFHIKEISPSGWISLSDKHRTHYNLTTCKYEYKVSYKDIVALNDKETGVPYKICSFDIEASSSHGDFPLPVKSYKKLAANIVEFMNKHELRDNFSQDEHYATFLRACIMTAFGYGEHPDIDVVYPKKPWSQAQVATAVDQLLTMEFAKLGADDATENSIEELFMSRLAEEEPSGAAHYSNPNADYGDDGDGDGSVPRASRKKAPQRPRQSYSTVYDLLKSTTLKNEEMINTLNSYFTKLIQRRLLPDVEGDKVTFIGSTFTKFGEEAPYLNHCIALDTCDTLPDLENSQIDAYSTEREVLLAWTKLIQQEDPDIIIGYNIFGFDYAFMFKRAEQLRCVDDFLMMSRNRGELCGQMDDEGRIKIEESSIVIASGQHDLQYIKMGGRLQIDLYNYFRRSVNLEQYKLDYVSGYFIGDGVFKIEPVEAGQPANTRYKIQSKNLSGLKKNDFINFEEIEHTSDKYNDGEKFKVLALEPGVKKPSWFVVEGDLTPLQASRKKIKWCLAKDDVTPQDIFRLTNEGPAERSIVAKYCIQDCNLVYELLKKIDIITEFIEMSKLCSVPINFLVMRGQGIKLTSFIAKKCREKGTLMPVIQKPFNPDGYEGAIVLEPKTGLYLEDPVACVDYSSLYPSSMISENICHSSKVWTKEYDLEGNLVNETGNPKYDNMPGYEYVDVTHDTFKYVRKTPKAAPTKVKTGTKTCRFAQYPEGKAIIPSVLQELLNARKATKKKMKAEEDPFMKNILDKRQLSIKLTANSLYGGTGAATSTIYEPDVAASTTATGRKLLTYAKRFIEEVYGDCVCDTKDHGQVRSKAKYIYGDTDSVFFCFYLEELDGTPIKGHRALEITIELAQEVGEMATKFLKMPHDLEYEKTFLPFCLLSKKRYVGMLYEEDPNKGKRKSMGIVLKRRDNAPIVKDVYGGIIDILMKEKNIVKSIEYLQGCLDDIVNERCDMGKLVITKSLRSHYKNPLQIAHKVLADRMAQRDPGNKPKAGDRIPFVYIVNDKKKALQGERIEHPDYIRDQELWVDYAHYITNQIMKPVQQVFSLVLYDIPDFKNKMGKMSRFKKELKKHQRLLAPEKYKAKEEQLRNKEIKKLLFDKHLELCKKGNHPVVADFFGGK